MKSASISNIFRAAFVSVSVLALPLTLPSAGGLFGAASLPQAAYAETVAPQATPPAAPTPATPGQATPASPPSSAAPSAVAPPAAAPSPDTTDSKAPGAPGVTDEATTQTLDIPARPVAFLNGKSDWENGFKTIMKSIATVETEVSKAGLKQGGKAITVFTETNDNGFSFEAMVPLAEKPEGKDQLGNEVRIGQSPAGKAIKFQHRGAYDDIDSTYDLITAYLDEKGLEAQNLFIEEYLTDTKNSDDQALEVDIYVFIK